MDFIDENHDHDIKEALDSAYRQINYYSNLPRHIKGTALKLTATKAILHEGSIDGTSSCDPAYVVNGSITVINGKINIPMLYHPKQFSNHNVSCEHP